ncbi:MAG: clostripain-related cysteine peptidase [Candidatus Peribacteraceae bacterium]|nr:clostripain-related cysteine peptidase [Candidatus Peribacteraceae bacterium]
MKLQVKIHYLIAIFLLGLAHVSAQELAPSKTTFKPGEDVVISFSGGPGNAKDWVGIYKEGQTPGEDGSTQYEYVAGETSGELMFDPLPVGKYEAHLFEDDGYEILASGSFEVSEESEAPKVSLSKADYEEGEQINVSFSGGPGNAKDWVGIYKEGQTPGDVNSVQYKYVDGKTSGELVFDQLPVGKYEAHLLEDDGYGILASTSFSVKEGEVVNTAPAVVDRSVEVYEGGTVSVTLTGSDEDGDALGFTVLSQPKNGTLTGTAPALAYSPKADYSGSDSFTYKVNDGEADSNVGTVSIEVKPEVELTTEADYFYTDSGISISFSDARGNAHDVIGIYKEGSSVDDEYPIVSLYVGGELKPTDPLKQGVVTFENGLPNAGSYFAVYFHNEDNDATNEDYDVLASLSFSVKEEADGPKVSLSKADYEEGEKIGVTFSGGPGNAKDWVGIYKEGQTPGDVNSVQYKYVDGKTSGELVFDQLPVGKYEAHLLEDDGYEILASGSFEVSEESEAPKVTLSKADYVRGEDVVISFSGGPGNAKDWMGIYKEGQTPGDVDSVQYKYLDGKTSGEFVFNSLATGKYEAYLFEDDSYEILATAGFRVIKKAGEPEDNWTVLVYGHADHNLGGNLVGDLIEMEKVGSGDGLNIVVQTDFNPKAWVRGNKFTNNWLIKYHNYIPADMKNKVCRLLVDGNKDNWTFDSMPIETLPETENMDNPQTLSNFINWGIENYPAKKYGLVLWDHGGQYTGYGGDSQNGTYADFGWSYDKYGLKTKVVRDAIQSSFQSTGLNKFDFLTFDTCLMAGVEVLVDMHDLTDVFMACAEIDYGAGWDYKSLNYLKQNPEASTIDFAKQEVADWDKHHSRYGADIELRNHAAFDFSKYNKFKTAFIEFAQQLTAAGSDNTQVITRARRDAIHYWLRGVGEVKKPTDYIDLGHFSLVLADSITEGGLKNACLNLATSINDMVISKSTGNSRKDSLGLSIYYPYSGDIGWKYKGLNFFKEEYGGDVWLQQLDQAKSAKNADTVPPFVVVEGDNSSDTERGKSLDGFNGEKIVASVSKPALFNFSIDESPDAYEAFASLVSNEETDNPNEYIYLGEVANIPLKGSGDYKFSWNGTLPVISKSNSDAKAPPIGGSSGVDRQGQEGEFPVYLGGWYIDTKSNTMISFVDYQPDEDSEKIPLIFITKFDDNGMGAIDTILYDNEDESWLSPASSNIELQAGGKIWPIYYTEEFTDDGWGVHFTYFEDGYIKVPEEGPEELIVSWEPVTDGTYGIELQTFDNLGNGSDVTEFEVTVGGEGLPNLMLSREGAMVVLSWPMEDGGEEATLQWTEGLGGEWTDVPSGDLGFGGAGRIYKESGTGEARFFRLIKR